MLRVIRQWARNPRTTWPGVLLGLLVALRVTHVITSEDLTILGGLLVSAGLFGAKDGGR
jgi:hypothetical protein